MLGGDKHKFITIIWGEGLLAHARHTGRPAAPGNDRSHCTHWLHFLGRPTSQLGHLSLASILGREYHPLLKTTKNFFLRILGDFTFWLNLSLSLSQSETLSCIQGSPCRAALHKLGLPDQTIGLKDHRTGRPPPSICSHLSPYSHGDWGLDQ